MRDFNRVNRAGQAPVEPIARAETTMLVMYTELDVIREQVLDFQRCSQSERHPWIQSAV